jgi:TRAP-type uncharacterized transport system substrate-binding protein
MGIGEFGQLKGSKLTVNVGPKGSSDYQVATDLLKQYQIKDINLTYYEGAQLLEHYGDDVQVAIMARTHPDQTLVKLINKKLTRMIEIIKYNDGNIYQIALDEKGFYQQHPYYSKNIVEKDQLASYYTNLSVNETIFDLKTDRPISSYRSRFINTISTKYYLFSNISTSASSITQLLYNIKLNMNSINQHEFIGEDLNTASLIDYTLSIPVHPGSTKFFENTGLYTNISHPSCILINGRCDHQQLYQQQLEHDFGPTFDQMYNQ